MRSLALRSMLAGLVLVAVTLVVASDATAQCATCPTPTVAYQPVIAQQPVAVQQTVAYKPYTGWYPGKWLDQRRLRRAGLSAPTAYRAVPYTAAYTPSYTAAYAPAYTTAYRPYVTSFAPLARTSYYYPVTQTVARPVVMRPIVAAPACNACNFAPDCGCDACSTGVGQAVYSEPACSSCATGTVTSGTFDSSTNVGPQTPQPSLKPESAPDKSIYDGATGGEDDALKEFDPGPTSEADPSTFNPPRLLFPGDRTASHKPTVDVRHAVYRGPAKSSNVVTSTNRARTQAEIDAEGWSAVPSNR